MEINKKWKVTYLPTMNVIGSYWTKGGALRIIRYLAIRFKCGSDLELTEEIARFEVK